MYIESNMEIYKTIYKIDSQWKFSVTQRTQWLCDNLEGWGGKGDGKEVWEGRDTGVPIADSR